LIKVTVIKALFTHQLIR